MNLQWLSLFTMFSKGKDSSHRVLGPEVGVKTQSKERKVRGLLL